MIIRIIFSGKNKKNSKVEHHIKKNVFLHPLTQAVNRTLP